MDSSRIVCPHCHRSLNRTAQLEVVMEVYKSGDSTLAELPFPLTLARPISQTHPQTSFHR